MDASQLVISIQSQVVYGHVGNSAAVFPMQAVGLEVAPVPTVLLSNTPNHPTIRGGVLAPDLFAALLQGACERGLPARASYIVTGYIGSVEIAHQTADFIAAAKAENPDLIYLCDPVMGDSGPGLYVPEAIADVLRSRLLPLADLATPNQFELAYLGGAPINRLADLEGITTRLHLAAGARLICTGCVLAETPAGQIESLILDQGQISRHPAGLLPFAKSGTGDLFTGLVIAGLGRGKSLAEAVVFAQKLTAQAMTDAEAIGAKEVVLNAREFREALLLG